MAGYVDCTKFDDGDPEYWIAQMDKADLYAAISMLEGRCPLSVDASHATLANHLLKTAEFHVVTSYAKANKLSKRMKGKDVRTLIIQFVHADTDWSQGKAHFFTWFTKWRFVNIAANLFITPKVAAHKLKASERIFKDAVGQITDDRKPKRKKGKKAHGK